MLNTLKNFQELANLYDGQTSDLDDIAYLYLIDEDPIKLAFMFCKLFPLIMNQTGKYFNLTESDKASFAVEELHNAMMDFEKDQGAKIYTFYSRYLNARLRNETVALAQDKRKSDYVSESYEAITQATTDASGRKDKVKAMAEINAGMIETGYDNVELMDLLENEMKLSEKELKYCNIVMTNSTGISDSDIARKMGVTPAAINYMKKSLARKLMLVS
jgi:hypothetical protein